MLTAASINRIIATLFASLLLLAAAGCSSGSGGSSGEFSLRLQQGANELWEGNPAGLDIPLDITRVSGHVAQISLAISGVTEADSAFVSTAFSNSSLTPAADQSSVNLRLDVGVLPILPQQRRFRITATDGRTSDEVIIIVNVKPVERDDVYLLIGQSNMVGFGGDGTRQSFPGGPDEPNGRIKQFNVTKNNEFDTFLSVSDYTSIEKNFEDPIIIDALDPLHVPVDPFTQTKDEDYIGLGLSFAKAALPATSRNIILVPAAWSGTSFCNTSIAPAHWNALPTSAPFHGNTLLFDRALTRINHALQHSGGILRGILWHQGESDSNVECANQYGYNLLTLTQQLRSRIIADSRGTEARGQDARIPFVVGTMSRGADSRDDLSQYSPEKTVVDNVHRNISSTVPHSAVSVHDDLTPDNGFPCGNTSCIHFGTKALREMGKRYYDALLDAAR